MADIATMEKNEALGFKKSLANNPTVKILISLFFDYFALVAAVVLIILVITAVGAPYLVPHDPMQQDIMNRLVPPVWNAAGSWEHIFGTDLLGRDLLSRIIFGTRMSMMIGFVVILISGLFGTFIGMLAGYVGGRIDTVIMRFVDFQAAVPYFLLAMTIMAAIGPGAKNLIIVLSIGSWVIFARFARSTMLSVRQEVFVEAARVAGGSELWIMIKHALPNLLSPIVTLATLELSRVILSEAGLSYLGLGVQPPQTAWGLMVSEGHDYISTANWICTLPGIMVMIATLSINVFATWLRRVTDPVMRYRL